MDDRYLNNSKIVQKIAKNFGYKLYGFDPKWSLMKTITEQSINSEENEIISRSLSHYPPLQLTDEFMGRLAIFMGYDWEFVNAIEELESKIEWTEKHKKSQMELRKEFKNQNAIIKEKFNLNINLDCNSNCNKDDMLRCDCSIIELEEEIKLRKRLKEMKI